ncbi:related to Proline-specific permease [Saccharomycodes ludwigii]|uniref:Related to Proline-specific permease n=1 Tax=Saccharomycodes ludwigii TaxID=36035 RepID=A0A376B6L0_9ASCO|nr:hypothetical protein SCDLUD_000313 [Saccharomycodes ludwigii]KAH3902727.1 hypothetical protein SCDLUD_000313 [Saccharomycodes ludwigii]SSD60104.1 related to Proline-specific permease [Saccharomycodes ludwigii]
MIKTSSDIYETGNSLHPTSSNKKAINVDVTIKERGEVYTTALENLESSDDNEKQEATLQKGLNSRQIQLLALGGAIGTGLFVGTGSTLVNCGPLPLMLAFIIISFVVYPIMNSIAEMICFLPQQGTTQELVSRYVDTSLGFAIGWNYAYAYAMLVASEISAAAGVIQYWDDKTNIAVYITVLLVVIISLNFMPVKFYGEFEFYFAIIKILCILGLIILSVVLFFGGGPNHDRLGFRFWKHPGPFAYHITTGSTGRFTDVWTAIIKSGFAFILSPELIGVACVEAQDTRRNISKASRRFIYRLVFFYICSTIAIGVIVSRKDTGLLKALSTGAPGASSSPFVAAIRNAGIRVLPHIINACILTSAWSSGNSFMYAASRTVLALANKGLAPKFFTKINKYGVPYNAVLLSAAVACLSYLNVSSGSALGFEWLSNISTISGFIAWVVLGIAHLRFRKAIDFNGLYDRLPYKAKFMPYATYWYIFFVGMICLTNGYAVFVHGLWNVSDFIAAYITLPIFFVLYFGHKLWFRTRWAIPIAEIDVTTGLVEAEEEAKMCLTPPPETKMGKFLEWLF